MRRRLVVSTITIVLVVLGALAVPVGIVVFRAGERQIDARLEQQMSSIAASYNRDVATGAEPDLASFDEFLGEGDGLQATRNGVYVYNDPPDSDSTRSTSRLMLDGTRIVVLTDADPLDDDFRSQLNILLMLALGALAAAAALAAVQARQLARPLERLARRASRLGDGDFSSRPYTRTNIPEIDHIGVALDTSAEKVATMLANERHFTADATHQLRTGIAGVAMRLEILSMHPEPAVANEAATGLTQTDQLNATIDDLLAAARTRSTDERSVFELPVLVESHVREWQPRFAMARRHVSMITSKAAPPVFGTKGLAGQVIDILIDNALKHGAGSVTLMIDGPSVIVIDQGPGVSDERLKSMFDGPVDPAARHGRGLPLARRLAQVDGATLDVVGNRPLRFRFQLMRGDQAPIPNR
ncbi:MAG: sensor histidine kinase [Acidimicrobiia bacterium]